MKAKRVMVTVLAAAALVTASVFGTMAYLTDSEAVTNTFTVGKVYIDMDETDVDKYGKKDGDTRVQENTYNLIPGQRYTKDPTIHVDETSEKAYLFVKVENNIEAIEDANSKVEDQIVNTYGWTELEDGVYYKVHEKVAENAKDGNPEDYKVFDYFKIDGESVTNDTLNDDPNVTDDEHYEGKTIVVTGYAVQHAGFDTAQAAWDATFGK